MLQLRRGAILMVAASAFFAAMAACVRACEGRIPFFEVAFFRSAIALPPVLLAIRARRVRIHTARPLLMFSRSVVGFASMALYFYALTHLELGDAVMLAGTSPIFVALLAPFTLGERMRWQVGVALVVALAGLYLLLSPALAVYNLGGIAAVASGICASFAYIAIRKLSATDDPDVIVFGFTSVAAVIAAAAMAPTFVLPHGGQWGFLIGAGVAAAAGQSLMTRAYRHEEAAVAGALSYATVVFSWILGVLVFHESLERHALVGGGIVMASGIYLGFVRRGASPPARF
jgi:drug/metabolite transporter (DMT)-like permease